MRELLESYFGHHNVLNPPEEDVVPSKFFVEEVLKKVLPIDLSLRFEEIRRERVDKGGYLLEHLQCRLGNVVSEATMLYPKKSECPPPVIVAFHDHGGYYFHGKERLYEDAPEGSFMKEYVEKFYEGRRWVLDLVEAGFAIFCPDAFYFGSRRLPPEIIRTFVDEETFESLQKSESDEHIKLYNKICSQLEAIVAKNLNLLGTNWPTVLLNEDNAWLNYLLSREDLNVEKMGVVGFSLGGFRALLLSAFRKEIKAIATVCFFGEFDRHMLGTYARHTFMVHVPFLARYITYPDIVTMLYPRDLMILVCSEDSLFPNERIDRIKKKIEKLYSDRISNLVFQIFQSGHVFNVEMQSKVLNFFRERLK